MIEFIKKILRVFKKILRGFKNDEPEFDGDYIQVEPTQEAIESNVNDDFTKQIVIYRSGKRTKPIPYSPEELKAIKMVDDELPIHVVKLDEDYEIVEGEYFGEVVTSL